MYLYLVCLGNKSSGTKIECQLLLGEKENNPIIGAGLGTLLPVQNTTVPILGTSLEFHQYSNPNLTSDLTYQPDNTPIPIRPITTGQYELNLSQDSLSFHYDIAADEPPKTIFH